MPPTTPDTTTRGPYPDSSLRLPLSEAQRSGIINWLRSLGTSDEAIWGAINPLPPIFGSPYGPEFELVQYIRSGAKGILIDERLISAYKAVESGANLGHSSTDNVPNIPGADTIKSAADAAISIVRALTNPHTWIRVAEFTVGALLVGVGLSAAVKGATR